MADHIATRSIALFRRIASMCSAACALSEFRSGRNSTSSRAGADSKYDQSFSSIGQLSRRSKQKAEH
ncbi:hypothetical protein [Variovorax sp. H27-G14]|uniref:hypothetical protein n=1 Tax=Variovorax sp. H27-G14 TaxID=3111914 RepID=UPI0038FCE599